MFRQGTRRRWSSSNRRWLEARRRMPRRSVCRIVSRRIRSERVRQIDRTASHGRSSAAPQPGFAWSGAPTAAERSPPAPVRGVAWHTLSTHEGCDRVRSGGRAGGRPTARSTDGVGVWRVRWRGCSRRARWPSARRLARLLGSRSPLAQLEIPAVVIPAPAPLTRPAPERSTCALSPTTLVHQPLTRLRPRSAPLSAHASHDAPASASPTAPLRLQRPHGMASPPLGSAALRLTAHSCT
jgi:hypothetical protein